MLDLDALFPQVTDMVNKKTEEEREESVFGPIIYSYTRAQALEDGVLVDVSDVGREAGISLPIALTQRVWAEVVIPWGHLEQSETGRLWDILWVFATRAKHFKGDTMRFVLKLKMGVNPSANGRIVDLKAMIGPGDNGEPVITIMHPDED